jgi:lipoyl(octanoyl) transferase
MDLAPFLRINPCGYAGLAATQMSALGARDKMDVVGEKLLKHLKANLYG